MGGIFSRRRARPASQQQQPSAAGAVTTKVEPAAPVDFISIADTLETGDLCLMYRKGSDQPHYAMFVVYEDLPEQPPLLLLKGKTKPMQLDKFEKSQRHVRIISASTRIFYGDYEKVVIRKLKKDKIIPGVQVDKIADTVRQLEFHEEELKIIEDTSLSDNSRSHFVCTFMVAHVMSQLEQYKGEPHKARPETFLDGLNLDESISIKLPETRMGPLSTGSPPFLAKLIDGIKPQSDIKTVPFSELAETLNTGDLVLFTGATSSGAIIRLFDNAEFSHAGIVVRRKINAAPLVWEASTNRAGLVDIETGKVSQGVELLPLKEKVFSGWYSRVAIRRLKVSDEEREKMTKLLLEFKKEMANRPYEKSKLELIRSAIDFHEDFLTFLKNEEEDLSSIFCSELVAAAYQRMGLLPFDKDSKTSNEYTPDDFTSSRDSHLNLQYGELGEEVYVEMKF